MNQTFTCFNQRLEDVTKAIAVLEPVIALIKTLNCKEKERDRIAKTISQTENDLKNINEASSKIYSQTMKADVEVIYQKCTSTLKDTKKTLENQDKVLANLENEIYEYLTYTHSFFYVSNPDIAAELLLQATEKEVSNEKFFAIMLLLLNEGADKDTIVEIASEVAKKTGDEFKYHLLMNIETLSQNDICRFIRESK